LITQTCAFTRLGEHITNLFPLPVGDGTHHDGGPKDPRIGVIKVSAKTATYAVSRKNAISRAADFAQSTITGNSPTANKLREISEEIATWRASNALVQ
jgi:hypothetical protein